MPLTPLNLPAGFYRNGTDYEQSNRWRDGSLVRWMDGSMRPIGGWTTRKDGFCDNPVRGMHSWQSNNGTAWLAGGSHDQLVVMTGGGISTDITPDDLAAGREHAAVNTGYGFNYYGTGYYGQPRPITSDSIPQEATTWQLDNFGQNLIALHQDDGRILEWSLSTAQGGELVQTHNFDTDTNWTKGTNWSIANGVANYAQYKPTFDGNSTAIVSPLNDTITINSHLFADGDEVKYVVSQGNYALGGLTANTNYFVVSATANNFKLSATSGGAAIDITANNQVIFDADDGAVKDIINNKIVVANTFVNNDPVTYSNGGGTDITGLVDNQKYFIVNPTSSEFQLAATAGGTPIDFGADPTITFDGDNPSVVDVVNNKIITSNTYSNNDEVVYNNGGGTNIGGLTSGTTYFIINASSTEFQLAATAGGAAIVLTANNSLTIDGSDAAVVDAVNDKIVATNTFVTGEEVVYTNGGGTDIAGLVDGTNYFVVNASGTEFQLSATSGGTALDITGVGAGASHQFRSDIGSAHTLELDIGSAHVVRFDVGNSHQLQRINSGNLDQTVSGLVALPDVQDSYDLRVTLIDRNDDANDATLPSATVKVTGTTSNTVLVNQTLVVGFNRVRFGSDDTQVKIEIIPATYNTPNFDIDNVSLRKKTVAEPIANAPINNKGMVVTEERFIFALGSGGNSRKISWCDKENNTVWAAAATNEAGDIELATAGQIMTGIRTRGVTLIITDTDAHVAQYQGPPYVYGFQRIGTHCGAVSRLSAVATDQGVYWYGQENFHYFDGNSVQTLKCDVHDYVFGDFNFQQQSKVWGMANGANNEVWWFYCSENSQEIDRYVAFDYKEGHWLIGNLARTSGVSRGVFATPFMSGELAKTITLDVTVANDSGNKYYIDGYSGSAPTITLIKGNTYKFSQSDSSNSTHPIRFSAVSDGTHSGGVPYTEGVSYVGVAGQAGSYTQIVVGDNTPPLFYYCVNHGGMGGAINIGGQVSIFNHEIGFNYDGGSVFCETGPISIGNGDQIAKVSSVIPDEKTQGDVDLKFKTRFHPNDTEREYGPFNPTNPTSMRFSGRQVRMRVEGDQATDWRVGTMRLEVKAGGRR